MKKLLSYAIGFSILSVINTTVCADVRGELAGLLEHINNALEQQHLNYKAVMVEYVTADSNRVGNTVFFKDVGNKRLEADFVPFDPRRTNWSRPVTGRSDSITYAIDTTSDAVPPLGGLSAMQTEEAIVRAMATWDNVRCANIPIVRNTADGVDLGVAAWLDSSGSRGGPFIYGDIQHAGWDDIDWPDPVLAATVIFWFDDPPGSGNFTDIDNNDKFDVAFSEIYYDPSFPWAVHGLPTPEVDVETIALHEAGHGLSQGHFGTMTLSTTGKVKFVPAAVMNAGLFAPRQNLLGTDIAGHCGIWSQWPKR
ncbi:MAG: hypothetical protein LJE92_06510 [Gammaproteobacteria bacterium]|jgi:hypothetical protein|nr:hypothetical protein [Gammaproteobacteria bacterium]